LACKSLEETIFDFSFSSLALILSLLIKCLKFQYLQVDGRVTEVASGNWQITKLLSFSLLILLERKDWSNFLKELEIESEIQAFAT